MSKSKTKQDESELAKNVEDKKESKKPKIIIPPLKLSPHSASSSPPSSPTKPVTGSQMVAGKLPPILEKSKEKKNSTVGVGNKVGLSKVEQLKKSLQLRPEAKTSKGQPKAQIGKIVYPPSVDSAKKEPTPVKTVKLGPKSMSKIEEKSSSSTESSKSKEASHEKCKQQLTQADEKIQKLESELKNEKLNVTKLEELHQAALKETEITKKALNEKLEMITKLTENVQEFEKKIKQNVKLIRSLKKDNEDAKKQIEQQKMESDKREAELNQQIQELTKKLERAIKAESEMTQSHQREKVKLTNEKKVLEQKIQLLENEKSQMDTWQKANNDTGRLELLLKENQVLKEELSQVKMEKQNLATQFETALIEKHFMNEQLADAVDQLEIDFEEKTKLKNKLDSFRSKLTEVNQLINEEKELGRESHEVLEEIRKENKSLKIANQELGQSRLRLEQQLQKVVNEKKTLFEAQNKCKTHMAWFQKLLKEFEKQKEDLEQVLHSLQNAKQSLEQRGDKQLDISCVLAIYQSIEDDIDKINKQSDLHLYKEEIEWINSNDADHTFPLDNQACIQRLRQELADKSMKLEWLNKYLSKMLEFSKDDNVTQGLGVEETTLANLKARLERTVGVESELAALKGTNYVLNKAIEEEKKINYELKELLRFREEEYEKQVKLTNDLRAYLDESENSLHQIREEYKSLLRANEEHNKSMEDNINHKIFLENQIEMLEEKQRTLDHQIDKLKHLGENKSEQKVREVNHVPKVASQLSQHVAALENEKCILISELEELKKQDLVLVGLIEKDRVKCEEISINLGNARKRLNEILEIDKDKDYLNFLLEGQDSQVIKFKKEVVQKLIEQSQLVKAFEKVLKEITSLQDWIPEEATESKFDFIFHKLTQQVGVLKTKLGQYKKSFHNSNQFLKSMVKSLQNHKNTKNLKRFESGPLIDDLKNRLKCMKQRIQEIEYQSNLRDQH